MSILSPNTGPNEFVRDQLLSTARQNYRSLLASYRRLYSYVWRHDQMTPEEILESLHTEAAEFLGIAVATYSYLIALNPEADIEPPMLYPISIESDGTATIDRPSSSSSASSLSSDSTESDSTQDSSE